MRRDGIRGGKGKEVRGGVYCLFIGIRACYRRNAKSFTRDLI